MDRSLFIARLIGPTFVAIALGMLINPGMYESMIAEALHPGISFYLSGLLSLLAGLAIVNHRNNIRTEGLLRIAAEILSCRTDPHANSSGGHYDRPFTPKPCCRCSRHRNCIGFRSHARRTGGRACCREAKCWLVSIQGGRLRGDGRHRNCGSGLISASSQKQPFAVHQPMSALPPKADICSALPMSALGQ